MEGAPRGELPQNARAAKPYGAQQRHRIIPGYRRFCLAAEHPEQPSEEGHAARPGGAPIPPDEAPANAGPGTPRGRPGQPNQIGVNEGGQVHAGNCPRMMPEAKAWIDLEKMQRTALIAI